MSVFTTFGKRLACAVCFTAVFMTAPQARPSFDCSKATTADEKAICADPVLADIDVLIAEAYRGYEPRFQPKKRIARQLLKDRGACGGEPACIAAVLSSTYSTYLSGYDAELKAEPWVRSYATGMIGRKAAALARAPRGAERPLPEMPGQCARTRIDKVTTRFGEPLNFENRGDGIVISYENGGHQVSYSREGLRDIQVGHEAVICLMRIPRDCPEGDERGRMYYTLDLETFTQWTLPDSAHFCGGA
jgi:uncharacterized protein